MTGFICIMMLLAGFPRGDHSDYTFLLSYLDGDANEIEGISEGAWFALFETDSVSELRTVELLLRPDRTIVEDWQRPVGTYVEALNESEKPKFYIWSSKSIFTEGPVATAWSEYQHVSRDTPVILAAPDLPEYRLFTTEEGLFLSDNEICQHITETYPGALHDSNFISVVWAGDIDRDGIIDLIIDDVSDGYIYFDYGLYLSSEAEPGSIVKMVASFFDVYY